MGERPKEIEFRMQKEKRERKTVKMRLILNIHISFKTRAHVVNKTSVAMEGMP